MSLITLWTGKRNIAQEYILLGKLLGTQLASYSINRLLLNDVLTETHSSET